MTIFTDFRPYRSSQCAFQVALSVALVAGMTLPLTALAFEDAGDWENEPAVTVPTIRPVPSLNPPPSAVTGTGTKKPMAAPMDDDAGFIMPPHLSAPVKPLPGKKSMALIEGLLAEATPAVEATESKPEAEAKPEAAETPAATTEEPVTPVVPPIVASQQHLGDSLNARVERVIAAQWMSRYSDGQFHPERLVTRAELAAVLVKAFDLDERKLDDKPDLKIPDVTSKHWASPSIQTMLKTNTMLGYHHNDRFYPNHPVSRAEGYAIVAQAYGVFQFETDTLKEILAPYKDVNQIPYWANKAVATSIHEGFVRLRGKNAQTHLYPLEPLNRGDLAYALDLYLGRKSAKSPFKNGGGF